MGGESKWRKMKLALGLNTCLYLPKTTDDDESVNSRAHAPPRGSDVRCLMPTTPTPSSSGLQMSKYGVKSSNKQMCAICLTAMKPTDGHAIFTAECSHAFHFHCITSNVKHGNRVCPICRAKWKDIPLESSGSSRVKSSINPGSFMILHGMPHHQTRPNRNAPLLFQAPEPPIFDDDELVNQKVEVSGDSDSIGGVEMKTPESTLGKQVVSIEVDRQRNRLTAANAIAEARVAAERGDLAAATSVLDDCRKKLSESVSASKGDRLCIGLVAELREMKERMASRRVYESSGRAYVLSGLSSHSWQRATARGDSTEMTSQIQSYQTQSMVDMVNLSQTMCFSRSPSTSMVNPSPKNKKSLRSIYSFPPPQPR
ncbi:putative chromatin regulator PHD family [Helianthus debilis subsp. tardiflorus]